MTVNRNFTDVSAEVLALSLRMYKMDDREYAAAVQEMNRLRGELCRIRGVAEQDISADGYDISQRSYESSRDRWIQEITSPHVTEWLLDSAREAYAEWIGLRPDLVIQDRFWFASVPEFAGSEA